MRLSFLLAVLVIAILFMLSLNTAMAQDSGDPEESCDPGEVYNPPSKWNLKLSKLTNGTLDLRYKGYSPMVLDSCLSYGRRASVHMDDDGNQSLHRWSESSARFDVRVPFDMSRGDYPSSLELGLSAAITNIVNGTDALAFGKGNGILIPFTYTLSYERFRQPSACDVYPRWGQTFQVSYSHTPVRRDYAGSMLSAQAGFFLPGLFKHHSLNIECGYESQRSGTYRFKDGLQFPRGYSYTHYEDLYSASVNYTMPLLQTDRSLGPTFRLKRVKANLFYDHGIGWDGFHNTVYNSVGAELSADIISSRLPVLLDLGVRFSYLLKDKEYRIEPVCFGVSF